jgi:WhiB family redox-sensing transcriptional regulator
VTARAYDIFTRRGGADRDWQVRAACRGEDPEVFFPHGGGSGPGANRRARTLAHAALTICAHCPVTAECLEYALQMDNRFGVWGGTTERERPNGGAA